MACNVCLPCRQRWAKVRFKGTLSQNFLTFVGCQTTLLQPLMNRQKRIGEIFRFREDIRENVCTLLYMYIDYSIIPDDVLMENILFSQLHGGPELSLHEQRPHHLPAIQHTPTLLPHRGNHHRHRRTQDIRYSTVQAH